MKKVLALLLTVAFVAGLAGIALAEDTYDAVKKKGVLVVGVKDASPGFGYIDPKTREIVGYDADFAAYLAKKMGVKLEPDGEFEPRPALLGAHGGGRRSTRRR